MYMYGDETSPTVAADACSICDAPNQATMIVYTPTPSDITTIRAVEIRGDHEVMTTRYYAPSRVIPDGQGGEIYASVFTLPPGNYVLYELAEWVHSSYGSNRGYPVKKTTAYANHITEENYYINRPEATR